MGHYYDYDTTLESDVKELNFTLRGNSFVFHTDRGVFSRNTIDFGSRLLIESYQFTETTQSILEVGCGYGPISLAIARDFDGEVIGIDVNERAIELANENAELNGVSNVSFTLSNVFEHIDQKYDSIMTNPPIRAGKKIVHQICLEGYDYLNNQGEMWVVIQKKQGAPSLIEKMKSVYQSVKIVKKSKGYYIICAKRVDS